ncbi:MAG: sulfotransferase [Actinomycetota bacterium]|nr:sulfotransferase [Actinomycetota bacterium]
MTEKPLVFATVGTDHHPFDRLVRWLDRWLENGGKHRARCLVQRGTSRAPAHAESADYLDYGSMHASVCDAALVVCHGGPGTIMLAANEGKRPLVVPRRQSLGEHVDDHQVAFARRIAKDGAIRVAESEEEFRALLDEALEHPESWRLPADRPAVDDVVQRIERLVEPLVSPSASAEPPGAGADLSSTARAPVRVLYIGGCGRSGSTLLDLMLGQIPHLIPVGELRFIWKRGLVENQLCGCGARFRDCEFWTTVGEVAFGGWDAVDVNEMVELEDSIDRHRFLPLLLFPRLSPTYARRLRRYAELVSRLYHGIEAAAGGGIVVDSTKDPPFAFLLRRVPGLDVRVVHLVRDSRGVAFSWTKRVQKPERVDRVEHMDVYHPVGMSFRWLVYNVLVHLLERVGVPRLLLRYESLVTAPEEEIRRIIRHAGEEVRDEDLDFLEDGSVELGVHHTVAGNPMRFSRGRIALRVDDEWKTQLDRAQQRLIAVLTWPLLKRYGYLGDERPRR